MRCPTCHADIPDDAKFCIECGNTVELASTGPTVMLNPAGEGVYCPTCGVNNPPGAQFCFTCGQPIVEHATGPIPRAVDTPAPVPGSTPFPQQPYTPPPMHCHARPSQRGVNSGIMGGIVLIGLGLIFLARIPIFPSIFLIFAAIVLFKGLTTGRIRNSIPALIWLIGIPALFALRIFPWPGIVILIGLSIVATAAFKSGRLGRW